MMGVIHVERVIKEQSPIEIFYFVLSKKNHFQVLRAKMEGLADITVVKKIFFKQNILNFFRKKLDGQNYLDKFAETHS